MGRMIALLLAKKNAKVKPYPDDSLDARKQEKVMFAVDFLYEDDAEGH